MVKHRAGSLAIQVPVRVMREVDDGRFVRRRRHTHAQFVGVRQRVDDRCINVSWVSLFAVHAAVREGDRWSIRRHGGTSGPHHFVEPFHSTMQVIDTVVGGQHIGVSINAEFASSNAICTATGGASEVLGTRHVVGGTGATEHHINELSLPVRHLESNHDGAVVRDVRHHPGGIFKRP